MAYARTYFARYLSASEETRKESKNHWLNVFAREFASGQDYSLSASILAGKRVCFCLKTSTYAHN